MLIEYAYVSFAVLASQWANRVPPELWITFGMSAQLAKKFAPSAIVDGVLQTPPVSFENRSR
jgi:hypothetical protein